MHYKYLIEMLLSLHLSAYAGIESPMVEPVCRNIDMMAELEEVNLIDYTQQPLQPYEATALLIITSGMQGKGPTDIVRTDCGAHGWAHFQPNAGLGLNLWSSEECAYLDPEWTNSMYMVLYSPYSASIQLRQWRSIVGPSIARARAAGWPVEALPVAAFMTNSLGSGRFAQVFNGCHSNFKCTMGWYENYNERYARRVRYYRSLVGEST